MSEHEEQADRVEHELDDMQERSERLEQEISDARDDWERAKQDPQVPTAEPAHDDDEGPPPEADYPSRGD
jgi:predicted  nucleic acid-binding Zn-ribbon protein